jgi:hypothetical protein
MATIMMPLLGRIMLKHCLVLVLVASLAVPLPVVAEDASRLTPQQAQEMVVEVSKIVEQIRGLKFKTPVSAQIISSATARENFKSKITEKDMQELRNTQNAWIHLGLIPPGTDLVAKYLNLTDKDLLGYYEDGTKTFYVLDHVSAGEVRSVMAHELTHALEDQNYNLASVTKKAQDDDHLIAIKAVIEGSATVVELAFMSREVGSDLATKKVAENETKRAERLKIAPSFTQRSLLLPYLLGFTFLLRGKPWEWHVGGGVKISDLDDAYANPPHSTRQILHPEQYWSGGARPQVRDINLPDLASAFGPGWKKTTEGAIGEMGLAVMTGSRESLEMPWAFMPMRWTNRAADGTRGDIYQHYVNGDKTATLLLTRWETDRDALEFVEALEKKGWHTIRYGTNVMLILGNVADRVEAISLAVFSGASYH